MNVTLEFDLVDQQADDRIVHHLTLGKTDRLTCSAFTPGSDVEVFTLDLLGIALTYTMLLGVQVTFLRPPIIGVEVADVEGAE